MELVLTTEDRKRIGEGVRKKYAQVAASPEGLFRFLTGRAGLEALGYDPEIIQSLPKQAQASFCGVGNPFSLGPIHQGEEVLDIGCGAGVDTLVAAILAGPQGRAVGIDPTAEMLATAGKNAERSGLENVTFLLASAEDLPFADGSFKVVISNGAFNLVCDKARALAETFRVLAPGGRVMIADQILTGLAEEDRETRVKSWFK